ncbi:MAG TPA: type II secretion system protein GspN [bacterium]|nr:type II secretion system protein GspN [bacterium]
MSNWKRIAAQAAGYLALFAAVFCLTLYFTFDANVLKPALEQAAQKAKYRIEVGDISLYRLTGLDLKDVSISLAEPDPDKNPEPMKIDRLQFSVSLFSIPGAISAMRARKVPPTSVSYDVRIGSGKITGNYDMGGKTMKLKTSVQDLALDKITIPSFYYKNMKLTGKANAEISLELTDQARPETWNGKISVDIDKPRLSDFEWVGLAVPGVTMDKGTLIADIQNGTLKLNPLKLQGEDIPLSLTGAITLKNPLGQSILDVSGPLKLSDAYRQKNPLLSANVPSTDNFSYKGILSGLIPGI